MIIYCSLFGHFEENFVIEFRRPMLFVSKNCHPGLCHINDVRHVVANLFFDFQKICFFSNKSLRRIFINESRNFTSYSVSKEEISVNRFSNIFSAYSTWNRTFFHFFSYFSTKRHFRAVFMIWLICFVCLSAKKWYAVIIFKKVSHWLNIVFQNFETNFRFLSLISLLEIFQFLKTCRQ